MARPDPQSKPRGAAPAAVLASMSSIRRVAARPGDRYPVACLDAAGRPVPAPMEWYRLRAARNEPRSTSDTYLKHILPVLSDFREQGVLWNDRPEVVRDAFVDFLSRKLHLRVQHDKLDGERYALTAATPVSASTVNVLRAAMMNFYEIMAEKAVGLYRYKNPMTSEVLQGLNRVRDDAIAKGDLSMGGATAFERAMRQASAFVRAEKQQPWSVDAQLSSRAVLDGIFAVVEAIVADPDLAARDKAILLLLRYTGPRAFEPATMTVGGYRAAGRTGWVQVTSKGAHGRPVKFLYFEAQPRIQRHLDRYLKEERPRWITGSGLLKDAAADEPFFVTRRGDPYNYDALYHHWRKHYLRHRHLCPLPIGLHDIRHAFVTEYLLRLREEQALNGHDNAWRLEQKKGFGSAIRGWRNDETIDFYDHALDKLEHLGRLAAQQRGTPIVPITTIPSAGATGVVPGPPTGSATAPIAAPPASRYSNDFLSRMDRYVQGDQEKGDA